MTNELHALKRAKSLAYLSTLMLCMAALQASITFAANAPDVTHTARQGLFLTIAVAVGMNVWEFLWFRAQIRKAEPPLPPAPVPAPPATN